MSGAAGAVGIGIANAANCFRFERAAPAAQEAVQALSLRGRDVIDPMHSENSWLHRGSRAHG